MCGIYGTNKHKHPSEVQKILQTIIFRGPDYSGTISHKNFTFGHNRLAIIDLDKRSNQPMSREGYSIVFNGEIYNYLSIKSTLSHKGYIFETDSDTEVLLLGYIEYGESILSQINGMFAFVIYDPKKHIFFGARDRLGKKPFYYYLNNDTFEFASQPKQLRFDKRLDINKYAEKLYFRFGYIPEPYTIYNDIYKLEAGYSFTYDLQSYTFHKQPYWDISTKPHHNNVTFSEAKHNLKELLIDAVNIRLHADVPVGVFLSGGIDSSLIASIVAKEFDNSIDTFSVRFSDTEFDESVYAREVAQALGTQHHTLECDASDMLALIETLPAFYDEPYNDSSALPMLILSRETRKHVTVALSGDGGDELFWGYNNYFRLHKAYPLYRIPSFVRHTLSKILSLSSNYRLNKIAKGLQIDTIEALFLYSNRLFDFEHLFHQNNITCIDPYCHYLYSEKDIFERMSDYDIKTYLDGDIFTKVDRATMAYSLEARTPLVDYRIVEYAQNIPFDYKYKHHEGKYILKEILYDYLPDTLFKRPKKGFTVPLKHWFRKELKSFVYDTLTKDNLHMIDDIDTNYVERLIENHMAGKENNYHQLWTLIQYILWRKFYEN